MGICVSRRAMQANSEEAEDMLPSELPSSRRLGTGSSSKIVGTDVLNPARLLLESPRISTDLGEMGMLGLLFHKKYCKSSSSAATAVARTSSAATQCDKGRTVPTVMNANVLFECPAPFNDEKESEEPNGEKRRREQRWVSAGEEFFGDWEPEVAGGGSQRSGGGSAAAAELGVFEAEQYFKDDSSVACQTQQQPPLPPPPPPLPPPSMLLMVPKNDEARRSSASECSSFKRASSATSASGMWASCASASAVEIEEEASPVVGKRRGKGKELSKAFFKLLSASSSPAHRHQAKARKSTDGHVKDWMDKARKSLDEICSSQQGQAMVDHQTQAFGSPFPGSPNSESRRFEHANSSDQAAATQQEQQARSTAESTAGRQEEQGNDSDSSSDLFELDSVATSLSSARSSLSRLSSARSSIRKSTADEHDFSSFKESPSSQLNSSQHDVCSKSATPAAAARRRRPTSNRVPPLVESRSVRAEDKAGKPPLVRPKSRSDHALLGGSRLNPWNNSSNGVLAVQT